MKTCDINPWGLPQCPMCNGFKKSSNKRSARKPLEELLLLDLMTSQPASSSINEQ